MDILEWISWAVARRRWTLTIAYAQVHADAMNCGCSFLGAVIASLIVLALVLALI